MQNPHNLWKFSAKTALLRPYWMQAMTFWMIRREEFGVHDIVQAFQFRVWLIYLIICSLPVPESQGSPTAGSLGPGYSPALDARMGCQASRDRDLHPSAFIPFNDLQWTESPKQRSALLIRDHGVVLINDRALPPYHFVEYTEDVPVSLFEDRHAKILKGIIKLDLYDRRRHHTIFHCIPSTLVMENLKLGSDASPGTEHDRSGPRSSQTSLPGLHIYAYGEVLSTPKNSL